MANEKWIQVLKEIRTICETMEVSGTWEDCKKCPFYVRNDQCCVFIENEGQDAYPPLNWEVEDLERESND